MLQHGACQQQNKRASDTAQWLGQSQRHFTCLFVCCEKKVRFSEVKLRNLSLVCLRVFASFIGITGAARTPSVGRRARTRLVVVGLNFRILFGLWPRFLSCFAVFPRWRNANLAGGFACRLLVFVLFVVLRSSSRQGSHTARSPHRNSRAMTDGLRLRATAPNAWPAGNGRHWLTLL